MKVHETTIVIPKNRLKGPVDTIFKDNPATGVREIVGYKARAARKAEKKKAAATDTLLPAAAVATETIAEHKPKMPASVYQKALSAYREGDYYTCHQYCWNEIQKGGLKGRKAADIYALAVKSSYANKEFSSALIYYQDMRRSGYRYDDTLTRMAILSYFPEGALQRQEHLNIYDKDTAFVLKLVNEMARKDTRWLMVRSKVYGAIAEMDILEPEQSAAYKQRMEEDMVAYEAEHQPDDWKVLIQ